MRPMSSVAGNSSLNIKHSSSIVKEMTGAYVDDFWNASTNAYETLT